MGSRIALSLALVAAGSLALGFALPTAASAKSCAALNAVDPDNDGMLDIIEANTAAQRTFQRLNRDKDTTLEGDELRGRVSSAALKAADPDSDGSLDQLEWSWLTLQRFTRANTDGDLTIECDELATPAGKALMLLLR